jgi:hypothetical protein
VLEFAVQQEQHASEDNQRQRRPEPTLPSVSLQHGRARIRQGDDAALRNRSIMCAMALGERVLRATIV